MALALLLAAAAPAQHATDAPDFAAAEGDARKFQLAPGLRLETWAAEPQLLNPVAFSLVPAWRGTGGPPVQPASSNALPVAAYVAETHRLGLSVPDITQNTPWLLDDLSLRTVPEREAFLLGTAFATNTALLTRDSEILRFVADTAGDSRADRSEVFADGFNSPVDGVAAGVLAQGTNVWFGNIPNLWRFSRPPEAVETPTRKADGQALLATGFGVHLGVIGHDLHGLIRGPDGRLYMSFGDRGVCLTNREGFVINLPDTGGVLRCEPDGRGLEVFCIGLRNPHELAFDDFGNLFTVDNDTAGADRCRVLHLVEGGDYGWRASYQHMRGFGPWVQEGLWAGGLDGVLPPAGYVSQGPAGLAYHPGTGFGRYAGKFLHADFPGGVWAFSVQPHGASFAVAEKEKVLWNAWPTDVEFGPDGALYVLDWVAGWGLPGKGRIHRISDTTAGEDPATAAQAREVYRLLAEGMTHRPEKELLELLGHPDRRVRLEAQWELAGRGNESVKSLAAVALNRGHPSRLARLHAIWAIGQIERTNHWFVRDLNDQLHSLASLLTDSDPKVLVAALRMLSEAQVMAAGQHLPRLGRHSEAAVRREVAMAHARLTIGGPLRFLNTESAMASAGRAVANWLRRLARLPHMAGPPPAGFKELALCEAPNWLAAESDPFVLTAVALAARPKHAPVDDIRPMRWWHFDDEAERMAVRRAELQAARATLWPKEPLNIHSRFTNVTLRSVVQVYEKSPKQVAWAGEILSDGVSRATPQLALESARAINDLPVPEAYPALAAQLGVGWGAQAPPPAAAGAPAGRPNAGTATDSSAAPSADAPSPSAGGAPADAPGAGALPAPWLRIPDLTLAAYLEQAGTPWTGPVPLPTNVATLRWQFLKRALNAHFRLGHATNAATLAGFAAQSEISGLQLQIPTAARVEALFLLGAWEVLPAAPGRVPAKIQPDPNHGSTPTVNPENWPGWFDRVVGLWRPLPPRPPDDARAALAGVFAGLVASEQPGPVQLAAVEAAGRLRAAELAPALAEVSERPEPVRPPAVRAAALRALAEVGAPPLFTRALNAALVAPEPELRRAAIALLGDHAAADTAAALGRFLVTETDVGLKQTALAALARLPGDEAADLLARQLDELIAGKMPAALRLDVALAAEARKSPALDAQLARYRASLSADPVDALADVLAGGDAARGRAVFFEKAEVQCSRCHQVKGEGGIVGPALDGIARRLDRRGLLETIVHPNAQIAPGYENVLLTLADGRTLAGTVKEEDAERLLLAAGEDGDLTLPQTAITKRERTLSAMPEGLHDLMSRRELRDLVEYLAGLR